MKSTSTCSCGSTNPSSDAGTGPRTVWTVDVDAGEATAAMADDRAAAPASAAEPRVVRNARRCMWASRARAATADDRKTSQVRRASDLALSSGRNLFGRVNTTRARASRWILTPRPQPAARLRLVCLPHAGGGASTYFSWGAALQPAGIEVRAVQYPGRESRFSEPPIVDAREMARTLADHWDEISGGGSCALYGHSMGALLGFELAVELARRGAAHAPRHLFLTGHQAPHLPYRAPRVSALPEAEFLPAVNANFGGIPAELMSDPEIAALIAMTLRADFTLVENYAWSDDPPLATPISVVGGATDPWTTEDELAAWAKHTRGDFSRRTMPGDHFFNQHSRAELLAHIVERLAGD